MALASIKLVAAMAAGSERLINAPNVALHVFICWNCVRIRVWKMQRNGGNSARQELRILEVAPKRLAQIAVHIGEHVDYPASKREIISACSNLTCFSYEEDREWLEDCLAERSFKDAEDVEDSLYGV